MTDTYADDAQLRVIELPCNSRTIVSAGPGTGKTWTLLERVRWLMEAGVEPESLLVLSFTRAVVRELNERNREMSGIRPVFPQTFDAFALQLVRNYGHDFDPANAHFDRTVELATELLKGSDAAEQSPLAEYQHIMLDEIQDLVGPRAAFVKAVLRRHAGGFTAFGDPAQAIYSGGDSDQAPDLFEELGQWSGTKTLSLETNFRFSRQASANLSGLRQELIAASNSGSSPPDSTRILEDSLDGGDFEDLNRNIELISPDYSVAVLTRDNATALRASAILWDSGIPHQLRQPQRDRPVAGWIAGVFDSSNSLTSEKMAERISELSATSPVSPSNTERAWRILSQLDRGGAQTGSIRGNEVAASIRMGRAPAELTERNHQRITVSTIHRAKGLEFDVCLIVEPYANRNGVNALEIRILFVALTRARHDVMHVATPGIAGNAWWTKDQRSGGRFVKRTMRHRSTLGIEVRVDDSDPSVPPGFHSPNYDSQAIQQKLRTQVFAGDKVTLARRETGALGLDGFNIIHETEGLIGITQIGFDECAQQNSPGRLPAGVSGLYVQDIETVAGDNQTASAAGLGNSGLWLRPRIAGLGDFS